MISYNPFEKAFWCCFRFVLCIAQSRLLLAYGGIQGFMVTCETEQGPICMESERVSGRFMWCSPKSLHATFSFLFFSVLLYFSNLVRTLEVDMHVRLLD